MEAQKKSPSLAGEYYLTGVMETACGFKLNSDSSFQFFFSYGALDRFGEGKWSAKGNTIQFNSKQKPAQDFALLRSSTGRPDSITIQVKEMNEQLFNHVYCKIAGGNKTQEGMADETGRIQFVVQPIDSIELVFEFCPEKRSLFYPATNHHTFEFKPQLWLMEVFFKEFSLMVGNDGLSGGHPLLDKKNLHYEKVNDR